MERLVSIDSLKIVPHDRRSLAALGMTWGVTNIINFKQKIPNLCTKQSLVYTIPIDIREPRVCQSIRSCRAIMNK